MRAPTTIHQSRYLRSFLLSRVGEVLDSLVGGLVLGGRLSRVPVQGVLPVLVAHAHPLELLVLDVDQQSGNPRVRGHLDGRWRGGWHASNKSRRETHPTATRPHTAGIASTNSPPRQQAKGSHGIASIHTYIDIVQKNQAGCIDSQRAGRTNGQVKGRAVTARATDSAAKKISPPG